MARFRLRKVAREDLLEIGDYTSDRWSVAQSQRYLRKIYSCFQRLADNRMLGRACPGLPGYRRFEEGRHVVFFRRPTSGEVIIVRVLHQRMLPEWHLATEEDEDE
jgi:toxin ParE1/3/4